MELALAHCKLGWSALGRGDHEIARTHFIESLPYAQKVRYRGGIVDVLTGLASVAEAQARGYRPRGCLARPKCSSMRSGRRRTPADDYEQALARAHTQFSPATFAAAWAQGQAMTLEALLAQGRDTLALARGMDPNGCSHRSRARSE